MSNIVQKQILRVLNFNADLKKKWVGEGWAVGKVGGVGVLEGGGGKIDGGRGEGLPVGTRD